MFLVVTEKFYFEQRQKETVNYEIEKEISII